MHTASPVESASQGLPIVSLREASLAHGDNLVLRCVNFLMHAGDFFYLTGRVGAGKSTLIATLTGQIPLAAGEGNVCSFDLKHLRPRDIPYLRRHLGIVFQDFKLLTDRNVYKNLHFALRATGWRKRAEIEQRIDEVLSRVGLVGKASSMPNQLSGGEQQRVAIARAMLNRPVLLLADEPTGNLDPETSEGILSLLREVAKGGTAVLMATHNYAMIHRFPSRTFHCRDGLLYEVQDPSDAGLD